MKKIVLLIAMGLTLSLMVAQSPCCKNKVKGASCTHSAQAVDVKETAADNKVLPACCKNKTECKSKAAEGLGCCKNKQANEASNPINKLICFMQYF